MSFSEPECDTGSPGDRSVTFETHRAALERLAYRMLGSVADAHDMVQDTWLRWAEVETATIREPRAWLLRACSRRCLDHLKSARVQRERYPGPWLPEPLVCDGVVTGEWAADLAGAARVELDESVSMALLTAMERLSPAERAALLLHDVFDHDYAEVAATLRRTEAACRKLVSRARQQLRRTPSREETTVSAQDHQRLLREFLRAASAGDFEGLKAVLRENVAFHADGGGKATAAGKVLWGAAQVARFFVGVVARSGARYEANQLRWCWYNGAPGVVVLDAPGGQPRTAFSIRIEDGRIAELFALRNPDKLKVFARAGE
ncbi:RNA polymerase sigma factor SigJ [Synoicihabitans lomoniglobus]|uniref:RNA polymerase sigma factor SigJ n=1 Tax=Synoicihabitans lomoniglobus TaxID=2909285 RepID=A0AAF0A0C5_9BACT|nr:RNA polymerase sigma factor SigJ [Opitutaceae bacterium LMO-M01]WED64918.1 RNA polymerase sigma factor SigJ [Opitutaceae bacterium LMO-M01]